MNFPSFHKKKRKDLVISRGGFLPFLAVFSLLVAFLFFSYAHEPYTRAQEEGGEELVEEIAPEEAPAEEAPEEAPAEEAPEEGSELEEIETETDSEVSSAEEFVEPDSEETVEEEEAPVEEEVAEEEILDDETSGDSSVADEGEADDDIPDVALEGEGEGEGEDILPEVEPTDEVSDEEVSDEESSDEEVADEEEVPDDEPAEGEELGDEEVSDEEVSDEESSDEEVVELATTGEGVEVADEGEGDVDEDIEFAEILQEEEDNLVEEETLIQGQLVKSSPEALEQAEVSKIVIADTFIEGKQLGEKVSFDEAIETLISLTTTSQDIEKAVIKSVLKEKDISIAQAVLTDQVSKDKLEESADRGVFESLEEKVTSTLAKKKVQEHLAADVEDDREIEDVLKLLVTDDFKAEVVKRSMQRSLAEEIEDVDVEDDITDLIKDDYNKFILEDAISERITNKESAQKILVDAVGLKNGEEKKTKKPVIKVQAKGPGGTIDIPLENLRFEAGSVAMIIDPIRKFTPGLYQLEIEINNPITGLTETIVQDFVWGVIAMNTDQDVYEPGNLGNISMGVLNDSGVPVCDAELLLEITSPSGSVGRPKIENTGVCETFDSLNTQPDYFSEYTFSQAGLYVLKLTATLPNGKVRTMTNEVTVENSPSYIITRKAATRLYPVGISPMTSDIIFFEAFDGLISDVVPADFEVSSIESAGTAISDNGSVTLSEDGLSKIITWQVTAEPGNTQSFRYFFDAPDISPEFYTIGPISSTGSLIEKRKWQIANDEPIIAGDQSNLVLHWKFNTGSGTTATDSTANGNDGTLTNMEAGDWSTTTPSSTNLDPYSLDFGGTDEYVTLADPASGDLDFGDTDDFTITGWINMGSTGTVLAKRDGIDSANVGYLIYVDGASGKLNLEVSDGTDEYQLESSSALSTSTWYHFAVIWDQDDASASEIYLDGTDDNATDTGTIGNVGDLSNPRDFRVATESDGGDPYTGLVDDIRVYNRVLTSDEIDTLAGGNAPGGVGTNLDVWLRADTDSVTHTGDGTDATAWTDQTSNAYVFDHNTTPAINGTFPTWNDDLLNGNPGLSFDTDTDRLGISSFNDWPTGDFLIVTAFKRSDSSTNEYIYSYSESSVVSGNYLNSGSGSSWNTRFNNSAFGSGTSIHDDDIMHIVTWRRTGSNISILQDGLQLQSGSNTGVPTTGGCLVFGEDFDSYCAGFTASEGFLGDIGEFLLYNGYPSATDQQKIDSYLAIKYGVSLDQSAASGGIDYLDSAGNTIWAEDTSDTFEYFITAIGQDDTSGIYQTVSSYYHDENILRVSEADSIDDLDFLFTAHDDGDRIWTTTGAPAGYQILDRQWQAQETNDIGTVDLEFDTKNNEWLLPVLLSGSDYYFVYDSDNDGDLSDETPVAMNDDGSTTGDDTSSDDKWTTQVNFPGGGDGRIEFTIATQTATQTFPVNIGTDLHMWLTADTGVTNSGGAADDGEDGETWTDQGPYQYVLDHNTTPAINGTFPTWNETKMNGHPALTFDDDTDRLGISDFYDWPTGDFFMIAAIQRDPGSGTEYLYSYSVSDSVTDNYLRSNSGASWTTEFGNNAHGTSSINSDDGAPHIITVRRTGSTISTVHDGRQVGTGSSSASPTKGGCFVLAEDFDSYCASFTASEAFNGDIAEFIMYQAYPSATDQSKLNSYFAIKYGISLDQSASSGGQDYIDSAGNTIWAADTSDIYENFIIVIGQDDTAVVDETTAKYTHEDSILQISEATSQDDLDFLFAAHNNGDRIWSTAGAPAGYQILDRKWQVQETNDIGTVDIEIDVNDYEWLVPVLLSGSDYYFVYDSDNDGDLSDETPVAMKDDGTTGDDTGSDDKWTTQLNFPDTAGGPDNRLEFTLATPTGTQNWPVGISDELHMWLRADSSSVTQTGDGTDATAWTDLGPYQYVLDHNTTPAINGTFPTWNDGLINGNPALSFSDDADRLGISDFNDWPEDDFYMTLVFQRAAGSGTEYLYSYSVSSSVSDNYIRSNSGASWSSEFGNNTHGTSSTNSDDGRPHVITLRRNGSSISTVLDGLQIGSGSSSSTPATGGCFVLAEDFDSYCASFTASEAFNGDLAEFIIYQGYPSATDQSKLNSYLAIKYGISLDQSASSGGTDYIDSAGNTIWAADTSDTYEYDIVAIGQDDTSALDQTSSKLGAIDEILQISEATSQDDLDFLFVANNNGSRDWTTTGAPAGYQILDRQWQVQEANDIGTIDLEIDVRNDAWIVPVLLSGSDYYFVYDSDNDGDLSDETPSVMKDDGTAGDDTGSDDKWTAQVNFDGSVGTADGRVEFALATPNGPQIFPGGISTRLEVWLRADGTSVTNSGDATDGTAWQGIDPFQHVFDKNTSPAIAGTNPTWYSSRINNNPSLRFNDSGDRLGISSFYGFPEDDHFIAMAYQRTNNSGTEYFYAYSTSSDPDEAYHTLNATGSTITTAYGNNALASSSIDASDGYPHITSMRKSGSTIYQDFDGGQVGTETNTGSSIPGGCFVFNEDPDSECGGFNSGQHYYGDIAEFIIFDSYPSTTEQQQIYSYLAIKYGISLDQSDASGGTSYLDSNGSTIWAEDTSDTYEYGVAGIGQDDTSDLDQTDTSWQEDEGILRVSEATSQDNLDFLIWAHNNGDRIWTSTGAPAGYEILDRQWQFQETNDIGTVDIEINTRKDLWPVPKVLSGSDYYYVYDSDNDGNLSDETPVAMNDDGSTTGDDTSSDDLWTGQVNFPSGGDGRIEFTLATPTGDKPAPGSVLTDLEFWFKADNNVTHSGDATSATEWADSGPYDYLMDHNTSPALGGSFPTYYADRMNSNPALSFAATDDRLGVDNLHHMPTDDIYISIVYKRGTLSSFEGMFDYENQDLYIWMNNSTSMQTGVAGNGLVSSTIDPDDGRPHITTVRRTSNTHTQLFDGEQVASETNSNSPASGGCLVIGEEADADCGSFSSTQDFQGDIAEIIIYDGYPSDTEQQKIDSYLALKYGITLSDDYDGDSTTREAIGSNQEGDYVASDGTTLMFDISANGSHVNDVAGIGQDDGSELTQTTSASENSDVMLTVSSPSDLGDLEFLTWANDNGSINSSSTEVPGGLPGLADGRLTREWLVQETGSVGTVSVSFDLTNGQTGLRQTSASDYALLVDTDGDFSNATVHTTGAAYNSGVISFTGANIADGNYIALAGPTAVGPAGITNNLEFWFAADSGVTNSGDGTDATAWQDQSVNAITLDHNTTPSIAGTYPTYYSSLINFHPGLDFDDLSDRIGVDPLTNIPTDDLFVSMVFERKDYLTDGETPFSYASSGNSNDLLITPRGTGVLSGYIDGNELTSGDVDADNGLPRLATHRRSGTTAEIILDGLQLASETNSNSVTTGGCLVIGADQDSVCGTFVDADNFEGNIAEFFAYSDDLTATEQNQVNSYLAFKYGITLNQSTPRDYLASDGTTEMWK